MVIAGEDRNDRQVLRILLESFCPALRGRLVEIKDSVRLRSASSENLVQRVRTLAGKAKARAKLEGADLACVFVHEDLDGPASSGYQQVRSRVQAALELELGSAHYVLATAEVEAWLLLFPDALNQHVSSWRVPKQYRGTDTSRIVDPKRVLMKEVAKEGRRYRESDAPAVFEILVKNGSLASLTGSNCSWTELTEDAAACCGTHLR